MRPNRVPKKSSFSQGESLLASMRLKRQPVHYGLAAFCLFAPMGLVLFSGKGGAPNTGQRDQPPSASQRASDAKVEKACFDPIHIVGQRHEVTGLAPANHSPSLTSLQDDRLMLVWFGGEREGAPDVSIYKSVFQHGSWSKPEVLLTRNQIVAATGRFVQKLGNPVVFADRQGLHLWVVSVSLGGWGGSRLAYLRSADQGLTWSTPKFLVTSAFLNVSTLVRSAPVSRETSTLLPAYFELSHKYPLLLKLDTSGKVQDRIPIGSDTGLLQPSLAVQGNKWRAYMRRAHNKTPQQVFVSRSQDAGRTWSSPEALSLSNPDSSVAAIADARGDWLAGNMTPDSRNTMSLVQMPVNEAGQLLSAPKLLDTASPNLRRPELSYPNWSSASDGSLHLAYTADGRRKLHHWVWPAAKGCANHE